MEITFKGTFDSIHPLQHFGMAGQYLADLWMFDPVVVEWTDFSVAAAALGKSYTPTSEL